MSHGHYLRRVAVLLAAATVGYGQGISRPSFEVASVKPARPVRDASELDIFSQFYNTANINPSQVRLTNQSLERLIASAYRVKTFQISAPKWIYDVRYDIVAKVPDGVTTDLVPEMLQSLLEDRIKLKCHRASKEFDVFVLSVREGGVKMPQRPADYRFSATAAAWPQTMESLSNALQSGLGRPVVDKTGLKGEYMVPRGFTRLVSKVFAGSLFPGSAAESATDAPTADDVRLFLRDLGLRLDAGKHSIPILVVDSAEKTPTEN